jgi:hypothetical protein
MRAFKHLLPITYDGLVSCMALKKRGLTNFSYEKDANLIVHEVLISRLATHSLIKNNGLFWLIYYLDVTFHFISCASEFVIDNFCIVASCRKFGIGIAINPSFKASRDIHLFSP